MELVPVFIFIVALVGMMALGFCGFAWILTQRFLAVSARNVSAKPTVTDVTTFTPKPAFFHGMGGTQTGGSEDLRKKS